MDKLLTTYELKYILERGGKVLENYSVEPVRGKILIMPEGSDETDFAIEPDRIDAYRKGLPGEIDVEGEWYEWDLSNSENQSNS
jgi:hypothetical protein